MIHGLTLTLTGDELQRLLAERAAAYRASATHWRHELDRTIEDHTEDEPLLPEHICDNEAKRLEWRADVLEFLRDHLEPLEIYRLGESDLAFGEVLPAKPGWLEEEEYRGTHRGGIWVGTSRPPDLLASGDYRDHESGRPPCEHGWLRRVADG